MPPWKARVRALLAQHEPVAPRDDEGEISCSCFNWRPEETWLEHIEDALNALED